MILADVLVITALLLLNGVFAMSEIAVVTSRRPILALRAKQGAVGARNALELMDEPTRFLSSVQIGITLIGVLAGAFGGTTIAAELDAHLETIPVLAPFSEAIAVGAVVIAISFCSLVIGELVPKRIAMHAPEKVASLVAIPMHVMSRIAAPLVTLLTVTTKSILRVLRVPESRTSRISEEEIRSVIAEGRQSGAVHVAEHEMLEGVFRLGDRLVHDLMTPRTDVDWLDVDEGAGALGERLQRPDADTILVARGSVDDVVGVIRPTVALRELLEGRAVNLAELAEPPLYVPGTAAVLRVLETFKQSRQRFAVVLDEYGGVEGVVTLDHVLEEIVGEVPEGEEEVDELFVRRSDGSWLVDGSVDIQEAFEKFGLPAPAAVERGRYRTLAGFVMTRLGRVPRVSDAFVHDGVRFEVIDMDQRRVDRVLVTAARAPDGPTGR